MKRRHLCSLLTLTLVVTMFSGCNAGAEKKKEEPLKLEDVVVEKSQYQNPVTGLSNEGKVVYGGDPAAIVDGDTVYLYTGHDTARSESYLIPEYQCYSSKDMINWNYEGVVMKMKDVTWADRNAAWASQAIKYGDKYYLYYCSWDKTSEGKQSIGVAVSDSPTGPFVDIGEPLVRGTFTTEESSGWNDIDPTVWVETDDNGVEHRYLMWGNGKLFLCELNEDMISVKDKNGDGKIVFREDLREIVTPTAFTEAPWLYRRKDENGKCYGNYYLFYAYGWREQMYYATAETLEGFIFWEDGGCLMKPAATSNTNHPAVIDFKGKTYFIYHNGSLDGGSGFRRVACIEELVFNEDGSIDYIQETAAGIAGTVSTIKNNDGKKVSHISFTNSSLDGDYPYLNIKVGIDVSTDELDAEWVIVQGKADKENENYVSIISNNKSGLYLTESNGQIVLAQNATGKLTEEQTFKTIKGINGSGVTFESIITPGMFITCSEDGTLTLTDGANRDACSFTIETVQK